MNKYWHSIRFKIIQLCVIFTFVLSLMIGHCFFSVFTQAELRNSIEGAEFNLHLITSMTSQRCAAIELLANHCATEPNSISYLSDAAPTAMQRIDAYEGLNDYYSSNSASTYIRRLILTDGGKRIIQMGSNQIFFTPLTEYNLQQFPYLNASDKAAWKYLIEDPLISSFPSSILLIQPVYAKGQHLCGKLYISVSSEMLTDQLENYQLNHQDALYVKIGENYYSFEDHTLVPSTMTFTPTKEIPGIANDANTKVTWCKNEAGASYISVSSPIGSTGMELVHYLCRANTIVPSSFLNLSSFAVFVALLLMGVIIYCILNRIILRPVNRLQDRLAVVAAGDFTYDSTIEWNNELGNIGRGINQLSESIQKMMSAQLEEEKKRQQLEYKMLQEQISPHFIYNTLNSIKWMATIQKSEGIAEMTSSLARLMRYLSKSREDLIPLQEELQLLRDYCTIQHYRYGNGIVFHFDTIENPELLTCSIPRFTLQPLVENAIFHGIEPNGGIGRISIRVCSQTQQEVMISISDDGVGMSADQINELLHTGEAAKDEKFLHTGILNVHRRIQYAFGPDYGVRITSTAGKGVTVIITIPKKAGTAAASAGSE